VVIGTDSDCPRIEISVHGRHLFLLGISPLENSYKWFPNLSIYTDSIACYNKIWDGACILQKSFQQPLSQDFQQKYANIVLELESVNKELNDYLIGVQHYCQEVRHCSRHTSRQNSCEEIKLNIRPTSKLFSGGTTHQRTHIKNQNCCQELRLCSLLTLLFF
jgi:hypothetical protein